MDVIQSIVQREYSAVRSTLPKDQLKAAGRIMSCRTAALGGRVHRCPSGETDHDRCVMYNSCHYRHCPQCNLIPRLKWLESYGERLLNCGHRQVVFTVPHELNELWRYNTRALSNLLFRCVSATLKEFLSDEKWLGAKAGYSLIQHTWGRNLSLHPHIHAVITEGGLTREGSWQVPHHNDYLPAVAMMHKFRGAYISGIRKLIRKEELKLPRGETEVGIRKVLSYLYSGKKWNVKVEKGYDHARGVVKYLSRYLRGGPIKSQQVKEGEDEISLRHKDHRSGLMRYRKFSKTGFVKQLLLHTPPFGMSMIRHYGLYATSCKKEREKAAENLTENTKVFDMEEFLESIGVEKKERCSVCNRQLEVMELESREVVH